MINPMDLAGPVVTIGTICVTAYMGLDTTRKYMTPPLIEGWAERASPVRAGEGALIEWSIDKRTDCDGVAGRVWYGENGFYLVEPYRKTALPVTEGVATYRIQTNIPDLAPSGDLDLFIKGYYDCEDGRYLYSLGPVELIVEDK